MFHFDNDHIFTGYLKQLLASVNIPTCKIYTNEFANYVARTGIEDPRVVESFGVLGVNRPIANVSYLRNNEISNLFYDKDTNSTFWKPQQKFHYNKDTKVPGLTRRFKNLGTTYNTETHEYLGEFLRFIRDYYNINLMSLYNCFNNKIYANIDFKTKLNIETENIQKEKVTVTKTITFDSSDQNYRIYAFPVKLFSTYTIAIDCDQSIELFCGLYNNYLDTSSKTTNLISRTYQQIDKAMFNQPFVYTKLNVDYWSLTRDLQLLEDTTSITRCDILNRERDLKLFIKVPTSCKSSITVLEGDFSAYNDYSYLPIIKSNSSIDKNNLQVNWEYKINHTVINFDDKTNLNNVNFKPISKLQLLAFNTGESYPFADRLIEYLSGSATTPIDGITDNIKRAQKVMSQNQHYFRIEGLWENQMQKIAYDYLINSGPIEYNPETCKLIDKRRGVHPRMGYISKSNMYDILGYIDKDVEKYYASWKSEDNKAKIINSIQNIDIYNGLYDI